MNRKLSALAAATMAIPTVLSLVAPAQAAPKTNPTPTPTTTTTTTPTGTTMTFSAFATHPLASKEGALTTTNNWVTGRPVCYPKGQTVPDVFSLGDNDGDGFCPAGQDLSDMAIDNAGNLVAGYGEWTINIDTYGTQRVAAVPLNVTTKTWGQAYASGSEAMDHIRKDAAGNFFIPTTDPSNQVAYGQTHDDVSGVFTNAGGTWHVVTGMPANHVLDAAYDNAGHLFMFNGYESNPPAAQVADNTTGTWRVGLNLTDTVNDGFERAYWGGKIGSTIYTAARLNNASTGTVYAFANGAWKATAVQAPSMPKETVDFGNAIWFTGATQYFDGNKMVARALPSGSQSIDFYAGPDGYLYALDSKGNIFRTKSMTDTWASVGTVLVTGFTPKTLAVYGDQVYVGGNKGQIVKSNVAISASNGALSTPPVLTTAEKIAQCQAAGETCGFITTAASFTVNTGLQQFTMEGNGFDSVSSFTLPTNVLANHNLRVVSRTNTKVVLEVDTTMATGATFVMAFSSVEAKMTDGTSMYLDSVKLLAPAPTTTKKK